MADNVKLLGGPLDQDIVSWDGGSHRQWAYMEKLPEVTPSFDCANEPVEVAYELLTYRRIGKTFAQFVTA